MQNPPLPKSTSFLTSRKCAYYEWAQYFTYKLYFAFGNLFAVCWFFPVESFDGLTSSSGEGRFSSVTPSKFWKLASETRACVYFWTVLADSVTGFYSWKYLIDYSINPQVVGWDSGVPFRFSNFLEDIFQPTSLEMSPTSNSGLSF